MGASRELFDHLSYENCRFCFVVHSEVKFPETSMRFTQRLSWCEDRTGRQLKNSVGRKLATQLVTEDGKETDTQTEQDSWFLTNRKRGRRWVCRASGTLGVFGPIVVGTLKAILF